MKFKIVFFEEHSPAKKVSDALCEVFLQIYIRMDRKPTLKGVTNERGGPQKRNSPQKTNKNMKTYRKAIREI